MQFCSHSLTALGTRPLPTASAPGSSSRSSNSAAKKCLPKRSHRATFCSLPSLPCGTCAGEACSALNVRMAQCDIPRFTDGNPSAARFDYVLAAFRELRNRHHRWSRHRLLQTNIVQRRRLCSKTTIDDAVTTHH